MAYGPGDYFGELSLLGGDHKRAATVRARTDATLLVLDREGFRRLLGPLLPQLQEFAKTYTGHRTRLGKVRGAVGGGGGSLLVGVGVGSWWGWGW